MKFNLKDIPDIVLILPQVILWWQEVGHHQYSKKAVITHL